ncbi:MAG: hypothetical protein HOV81_12120 [Kofleriaceae bacterium]|nr:hypothetical protein [Kofleriaceae bacterium]
MLSSAAPSTVASSLQRWILPSAEILTVGIPFCAFKLLTGHIALGSPFAPLGYALLALGSIDLVLNLVNLVALLAMRRRISAVCLTEAALRRRGSDDIGLALDVFLSFGLVALVVGCGLLLRLPAWALPIWNIAVVLNVLGAGVGRLFDAVRRDRAAA